MPLGHQINLSRLLEKKPKFGLKRNWPSFLPLGYQYFWSNLMWTWCEAGIDPGLDFWGFFCARNEHVYHICDTAAELIQLNLSRLFFFLWLASEFSSFTSFYINNLAFLPFWNPPQCPLAVLHNCNVLKQHTVDACCLYLWINSSISIISFLRAASWGETWLQGLDYVTSAALVWNRKTTEQIPPLVPITGFLQLLQLFVRLHLCTQQSLEGTVCWSQKSSNARRTCLCLTGRSLSVLQRLNWENEEREA